MNLEVYNRSNPITQPMSLEEGTALNELSYFVKQAQITQVPLFDPEYLVPDMATSLLLANTRVLTILNDRSFFENPEGVINRGLKHPIDVSFPEQERILGLIADGSIEDRHMESIVERARPVIPSRNYGYDSEGNIVYYDQRGHSMLLSIKIKRSPEEKQILYMLKGSLDIMGIDRSDILKGESLETIEPDKLAIILRDFAVHKCTNAYAFYKLIDKIKTKYQINNVDEQKKLQHKLTFAAECFSKMVYGEEQHQLALATRDLMIKGDEKAQMIAVEKALNEARLKQDEQNRMQFSKHNTISLKQDVSLKQHLKNLVSSVSVGISFGKLKGLFAPRELSINKD